MAMPSENHLPSATDAALATLLRRAEPCLWLNPRRQAVLPRAQPVAGSSIGLTIRALPRRGLRVSRRCWRACSPSYRPRRA